jgi:phage terminase large subunit-like protein
VTRRRSKGAETGMKCPLGWRDASRLARMTPEELREFLSKCSPKDFLWLDAQFEIWAAEGQIEPDETGWRVWLMMAGRGFGKTRAGAEWVNDLAAGLTRRIALVGATIDDARSVMVEGVSGILAVARRRRIPIKWEPSLGKLTWPMGSIAQLYSGDSPDGLRGPEHHFAWADELAKWRRPEESWSNLQLGLRAGIRPRALVTTTPRVLRLLDVIQADEWTVTTGGKTKDNMSLPKGFIDVMQATYGGTRLGRQELDGELMSEAEGSLFPRALLEGSRVLRDGPSASSVPPQDERFDRVVVGVDPPASTHGDACGIVVAGRRDGELYVLADRTIEGISPEGWVMAVARAAIEWNASHVIAEANQGGAMVTSVLKAADPDLRVKLVHATRGKSARAEPIAIRFERSQAFLAGCFPELEAELSGLQVGGTYEGPSRSPDRADACIWALTELSETRSGIPRVRML